MGIVEGVAQAILDGFDRHYQVFRRHCVEARLHFEAADWKAALQGQTERILSYDRRVNETVDLLNERYPAARHNENLWPTIKRQFIGLLLDHLQPECAETFYNSVACRVLHRRYYRNDYIFWRPTLNTEHLAGSDATYRVYYPEADGLRRSLLGVLSGFGLNNRFEDLKRDLRLLERALHNKHGSDWRPAPNHQFQVLATLFFRNKAAYIVGREIDGDRVSPMIIPLLQDERGRIFVDCLLTRARDVSVLFSFSRAYFMVDMEVPSAYVSFLLSIMPTKSRIDLYAMLGLQKLAKTLFYRELHHHLAHSRDNFVTAPGIRGTVMLVFTLPSFPFVFKIIRDRFDPPKKMTRDQVREKYLLVKFHDRVGRMADTLEYSNVAIPLDRVDPDLMRELHALAKSSIEIDGTNLVIRHVYIERRMTPLNDYLATARPKHRRAAILDFGQAIRDLAGANIFPGDMMHKNFGVTRHRRVVFYDYDEICYMTECRFRRIPPAADPADDLLAEPWFSVEENDVFPETFGTFFFPDPEARDVFYERHSALVTPEFWDRTRRNIIEGGQADVFPYPERRRFRRDAGGAGRSRDA
ncbi:bifunctional isocitrate dehydrogenase kinase/phosphatase [Elongatibacter sediminis]|uniref:Isocitrate dehydrogenase kinase/phosphatase n=1 Tax=Elongatibacter sediminis TaxID=3119006 RepID=A0AAW9R5F0_9GAMM